jgi:hypothetical protein
MAEDRNQDPQMDPEGLYQEDSFTDRKVGAIRRLSPVRADGSPDPSRPVLFIGQAEIMTNMGPMPINFEIEAQNLAEAVSGFSRAAQTAIERPIQQLQELRRPQASQLVVPQGPVPNLTGGGGRGGGKIQLP